MLRYLLYVYFFKIIQIHKHKNLLKISLYLQGFFIHEGHYNRIFHDYYNFLFYYSFEYLLTKLIFLL